MVADPGKVVTIDGIKIVDHRLLGYINCRNINTAGSSQLSQNRPALNLPETRIAWPCAPEAASEASEERRPRQAVEPGGAA